jgi:hypothetical protein
MITMTPQQQFEYKQSWLPGYTVRLHSDVVDKGKTWCKRQCQRHEWSCTIWTAAYEHTFHFENIYAAQNFEMEMGRFANQ